MNAIQMMLRQGRMTASAAVQGEADVAFDWDGVTFDVGEYKPSGTQTPVQMTLTIGGVPFAGEALCILYVTEDEVVPLVNVPELDEASGALTAITDGLVVARYTAPLTIAVLLEDADIGSEYRLHVLLPSGAAVQSAAIVKPGS